MKSLLEDQCENFFTRHQFGHAQDLLKKELKNNPENAQLHYLQGVCFYLQGKIGLASQSLHQAIDLIPSHIDALLCLSVLYNDLGQYDQGRKFFKKAEKSTHLGWEIKNKKQLATKHLELADLYLRYKQYDEALMEYSKAHNLDPFSSDIRFQKAKTYVHKGWLTAAKKELEQLKIDDPCFLQAPLYLGLLAYEQGEFLQAAIEWEYVLSLEPTCQEAVDYLHLLENPSQASPAFSTKEKNF